MPESTQQKQLRQNAEFYKKTHGKFPPWYTAPPKASEVLRETEAAEKLEKRRLGPTKEDKSKSKLSQIKTQRETLEEEGKLEAAKEKKTLRRRGPSLDDTIERQRGDIAKITLKKDPTILVEEQGKDEQGKQKPDIVTNVFEPSPRLQRQFDRQIEAKRDSIDAEVLAIEMGFQNTDSFFENVRPLANGLIEEFDVSLYDVLEQQLGFRPAPQYLNTPKGKVLLKSIGIDKIRDQVNETLRQKYGFDYLQAREALNAVGE